MIDIEKLEKDFTDGKAVNPRNVRLLIEEVNRLRAQWISVEDRLPDRPDEWVIAYNPLINGGQPLPASCYYGIWYDDTKDVWTKNTPTHWQELPLPPVLAGDEK